MYMESIFQKWQRKASKLETQVKTLSEELQPLQALKVELEVANGRLKSMEHFQARLKVCTSAI
jgi:peptidoglycan hydrolase CwlO-like protein